MPVAQAYQLTIVVELFGIGGFEIPVDGVHRVGAAIGVVDAFLVAEHLFAGKHERCTLRGEHYCLRQTRCALAVGFGGIGHGCCQLVGKGKVVVATYIIDYLRGCRGIGEP